MTSDDNDSRGVAGGRRFKATLLLALGLIVSCAVALIVGALVAAALVYLRPNQAPLANLRETEIIARVGQRVELNGSLSVVPGQPDARLRFDWLDEDGYQLRPVGIDPYGNEARQIEVRGLVPGERRIVLRVTNAPRCHRLSNLWLSPAGCEKSSDAVAHILFVPEGPCGNGLPNELVLAGPREIGVADRTAQCRLVLPRLIVTNGHELKIHYEGVIEVATGGTQIIAFREAGAPGA